MSRNSYNDRLFGNPIRKFFHLRRFDWLSESLNTQKPEYISVIEVGCFDGRSLDFLPIKPDTYNGFDADWEGGLSVAKNRYEDSNNINFHFCNNPFEINLKVSEKFSFGICMETLEHLNDENLLGYLDLFHKHLDGPLFVTVPNEIGPFFALKYFIKKYFYRDYVEYSSYEFLMQTLGKSEKVLRNEHKGFNHKKLRAKLEEKFVILEEKGIPFKNFPIFLNSQIGWILIPKTMKS